MRSVIHFRLNSFFAALEQLRKPELVGQPVIVAHKTGRGEFVVSASLECGLTLHTPPQPSPLRGGGHGLPPRGEGYDPSPRVGSHGLTPWRECYGFSLWGGGYNLPPRGGEGRGGVTVRHALRYCPTAIVVPADWDHYREASEAVMDILSEYSPLLEPHSLDKAYMDVTGCTKLFGPPKTIALEVQRRVLDEVGVPVSVGIAQNKLAACAASSACKPGGYMAVRPGTEAEFLSQLPVGILDGVGPKIEKRLEGLGVRTVGDLAAIPERLLIRQFGVLGSRLRTQSMGIDHSPVAALYPPRVIIAEHTFGCDDDDPSEPEVVEAYLFRMCERLAMQMRKRDQQAGSLKLTIEYEGSTSSVLSRDCTPRPESRFYTFKTPASSAHDIYTGARRIYRQVVNPKSEIRDPKSSAVCRLRSAVLTLSDLHTGSGIQLSLIGDTERRMRLDAVLETIRSRFGENSISCLRTQMA